MRTCSAAFLMWTAIVAVAAAQESTQPAAMLATPQEMAAAQTDVWGEAAIKAPGGPSYELFADLLPPLRYVNTAFRHYPLALCAPAAKIKARWISNGSGVNLRADKPPMWREVGTPVSLFVGGEREAFGHDIKRLVEPKYLEGHLPIVQVAYDSGGTRYEQEVFAPVRGVLAEHGVVFLRLTAANRSGEIAARIDSDAGLQAQGPWICDAAGSGIVGFGPPWKWDAASRELRAALAAGESAALVIATRPIDSPPELPAYDDERQTCVEAWQTILRRGTQLKIPEPIVQDAWRSLVIGNYLLADGDRMHYSAGNAYDHLYESECGDATRSLLQFGQTDDARRMVAPLLDFNRQATRYHVAGHKLQLLAHYFWMTCDAEYLREKRAAWQPVIDFIRTSRQENGLLPKDNYAGDIPQQVISLSSNSTCWRGLRDMAEVIAELGDHSAAVELRTEAAAFRQAILDAVAKSEHKDTQPPFIPIALLADEPAHDPLTATRMGSYYDLMAPYVLGSGVFPPGSERETWLIDYLRQHGGIALGMIRSMPHQGEFNQQPGVNVLYGLRYMLALLRRGDRDHALVGFYGHLAQAMTRGTFIGGEGSRFFHGDEHGRSFYLPPNSASNAMFLTTLRSLLIQDWDLDDDGRPETLRLLDAIPPRWLQDGAELSAHNAPTAFGPVSFRIEPRLRDGHIQIRISPLSRKPAKWTLRLSNPPGYVIQAIKLDDRELPRDGEGRVELPLSDDVLWIEAHVQPQPPGVGLTPPATLPGFQRAAQFAEQERWQRLPSGVRVYFNSPLPLAGETRTLVVYATPNGNTIEQTLGCAAAGGLDWHFDIQHVASQIRRLREISPHEQIILAVVQAPKLSWPAFRQADKEAGAIIRQIVESATKAIGAERVILTGHSGGGSFTFGYLDEHEPIPALVERIVFLDSNYAYADGLKHGDKLLAWLRGDANRRLVTIAYDDREITLNGKKVVSPTGGTFRASQRMIERVGKEIEFTENQQGPFIHRRGLGGQIEFFVHPNPENKILHTALVGEMNGLLQGLTLGTDRATKWGTFGGPRAYTTWIQDRPAQEPQRLLKLPPRPVNAPSGSQFLKQIESLGRAEREAASLQEITRGNVPAFLRLLKPISLAATDGSGTMHTATCFALPDYLAVGSDDDFFRIPMNPHTAEQIAAACEAALLTAKLSDEIFRQAELKLEPRPLTKDREAAATFYQHHQIIEEQRRGQPLGLLVAGIKKDVVLTNRLTEKPNRVAIYGWHHPDGRPIQPLYVGHVDWYVDYSHGIRLLSRRLLVDGRETTVAEVLRDPVLHVLLSNEGPITAGYK